jgi:hypothetical protein
LDNRPGRSRLGPPVKPEDDEIICLSIKGKMNGKIPFIVGALSGIIIRI